jgi:hypothetical protein
LFRFQGEILARYVFQREIRTGASIDAQSCMLQGSTIEIVIFSNGLAPKARVTRKPCPKWLCLA